MAWYRPDLYRRVLAYSITATNQQWPHNEQTPHGAWGFHESIIPNKPGEADQSVDGSRRQGFS